MCTTRSIKVICFAFKVDWSEHFLRKMSDDDIDNMDFELPMLSIPQPSAEQPEMDLFQQDFPVHPFQKSDLDPETEQKIKNYIVIYPIYFDQTKSLNKGRRVPSNLAVKEPSAIHIYETCAKLGLTCYLEKHKRNPRDQLVFGRVRVEKTGLKKTALLGKIASSLKSTMDNASVETNEIARQSRSCLAPWPPGMPGMEQT